MGARSRASPLGRRGGGKSPLKDRPPTGGEERSIGVKRELAAGITAFVAREECSSTQRARSSQRSEGVEFRILDPDSFVFSVPFVSSVSSV